MNNSPLVSICIPTYNRADIVGETIKSALLQTYNNIEICVCDNASDDGIKEVIDSFKDERINFYRNEKNLGIFGNFNECIHNSRGALIHILHSDDMIEPEFIERSVDVFVAHPDVGMTFSACRTVSEAGVSGKYCPLDENVYLSPPEGFRAVLRSAGDLIPCPSVIVKREIYEQLGEFSLEFPYSSDYYQWLRISREYPIYYIHNVCVIYRKGLHSESYQMLHKSPLGYFDNLKIYIRVIEWLGEESALYREEMNTALYKFARSTLFAWITRSDKMELFSGSVFLGLGLSSLSLIRPKGAKESIKRIGHMAFFILSAPILSLRIIREFISKHVFSENEIY